MKQLKFIVVENWKENKLEIVFGYVEFHRHLRKTSMFEKILGGGKFCFDKEKKEVVLFGRSDDFGKVPDTELKKAISLFDDWYMLNIIMWQMDRLEGEKKSLYDDCYKLDVAGWKIVSKES